MIALLFGVTLTGCQVHFDRDAVTFGKVESKKKKVTKKKVVKPKKTNQRVSNKTEIHKKVNKKVFKFPGYSLPLPINGPNITTNKNNIIQKFMYSFNILLKFFLK